jgi:hypothetical protein
VFVAQDEMSHVDDALIAQDVSEIRRLIAGYRAVAAVAHTQNVEGADERLANGFSNIETQLDNLTSYDVANSLLAEIKRLGNAFLKTTTPSSTPYDLTFLVKNAGMDATTGWSGTPALNNSCAEFYMKSFDFNQTLYDAPSGRYELKVKAFQRPGSAADVYNAYVANPSNEAVTTQIYMDNSSVNVKNIAADAQNSSIGGNQSQPVSGVYFPNDMYSASLYFGRGLYDNSLVLKRTKDADMTIGIRGTGSANYDWTIFDDFRLYYFGRLTAEQVTAIDETVLLKQKAESGKQHVVYDLSGRQVNQTESLRPGIYILDGKKIAVK